MNNIYFGRYEPQSSQNRLTRMLSKIMPPTIAENIAIWRKIFFANFVGSQSLMRMCPPNFIQCLHPVHLESLQLFLNDQNRSKRFRVMWAERKSWSVQYIQTRASTGLVVNQCAVAMSPKGNSLSPDMLPPNTFSLSPTALEIGGSTGRETITIRQRKRRFNKKSPQIVGLRPPMCRTTFPACKHNSNSLPGLLRSQLLCAQHGKELQP